MEAKSSIDRLYRTLLLSKFFVKGWGKVDHYEKLLAFRKIICATPGKAAELVNYAPKIVLEAEESSDDVVTITGHFKSPFVNYLPGLLPEEAEKAHFQVVLPRQWKDGYKPVCVQMAGTGDHFFWRRRVLMAKPLAKDYGIGSVILENPFYGLRKPKDQIRSSLHNVSDIFVMGGCLMLEAAVLLNWCKSQGFGPLGLTGVSMGGYMASIAAGSWPEPIVLVPCLSWTTASTVFTKGVMSAGINWKLLDMQYKTVAEYREKFFHMLSSPEQRSTAENLYLMRGQRSDDSRLHSHLVEAVKTNQLNVTDSRTLSFLSLSKLALSFSKTEPILKHEHFYREATHFMRGLMDEFTHMGNFCAPADLDMVIVIAAMQDAYVPREGVKSLEEIWPGIEVRYVNAGHVTAYLKHHGLFRAAIYDAFAKYKRKYNL